MMTMFIIIVRRRGHWKLLNQSKNLIRLPPPIQSVPISSGVVAYNIFKKKVEIHLSILQSFYYL